MNRAQKRAAKFGRPIERALLNPSRATERKRVGARCVERTVADGPEERWLYSTVTGELKRY